MLAELNWDKILDNVTFKLKGLGEQYSEDHTYHILIVGGNNTGKSSYINSVALKDYRHLPTMIDDVELSLTTIGKDLIHIWTFRDGSETIEKITDNINIIHGVIGFFDLTRKNTFGVLQARIGDLIMAFGKMYPLMLVGNKADMPDRDLSREHIMIYSYELGNCSCHRVPYYEMSAIKNIGLDLVISNMITMVNCTQMNKCSELPALARHWCNIPQEYSFVNETRQKLEIK